MSGHRARPRHAGTPPPQRTHQSHDIGRVHRGAMGPTGRGVTEHFGLETMSSRRHLRRVANASAKLRRRVLRGRHRRAPSQAKYGFVNRSSQTSVPPYLGSASRRSVHLRRDPDVGARKAQSKLNPSCEPGSRGSPRTPNAHSPVVPIISPWVARGTRTAPRRRGGAASRRAWPAVAGARRCRAAQTAPPRRAAARGSDITKAFATARGSGCGGGRGAGGRGGRRRRRRRSGPPRRPRAEGEASEPASTRGPPWSPRRDP